MGGRNGVILSTRPIGASFQQFPRVLLVRVPVADEMRKRKGQGEKKQVAQLLTQEPTVYVVTPCIIRKQAKNIMKGKSARNSSEFE
jgi:hypothetical protein